MTKMLMSTLYDDLIRGNVYSLTGDFGKYTLQENKVSQPEEVYVAEWGLYIQVASPRWGIRDIYLYEMMPSENHPVFEHH